MLGNRQPDHEPVAGPTRGTRRTVRPTSPDASDNDCRHRQVGHRRRYPRQHLRGPGTGRQHPPLVGSRPAARRERDRDRGGVRSRSSLRLRERHHGSEPGLRPFVAWPEHHGRLGPVRQRAAGRHLLGLRPGRERDHRLQQPRRLPEHAGAPSRVPDGQDRVQHLELHRRDRHRGRPPSTAPTAPARSCDSGGPPCHRRGSPTATSVTA